MTHRNHRTPPTNTHGTNNGANHGTSNGANGARAPEIARGSHGAATEPLTTTVTPLAFGPRLRTAYARREGEMLAIPEGELMPINLDLIGATVIAHGALPRIAELRREIATLSRIDLAAIDAIEEWALAVTHAHFEWVAAQKASEDLALHFEKATQLREVLGSEARTLATRGLLDPVRARSFQRGTGYRAVAEDLMGVVKMLRERWSAISSRTTVTLAELDEAEDLVATVLGVLGGRDRPFALAKLTDLRLRAWTCLFLAYDEARKAITFLRWKQGDADSIVPSLWGNRGRKRSATAEQGDGASPPAPAAAPAGGGAAAAATGQGGASGAASGAVAGAAAGGTAAGGGAAVPQPTQPPTPTAPGNEPAEARGAQPSDQEPQPQGGGAR